jgi:hypothetical protein
MPKATAVDELIEALQDVLNLDELHQLVSNEHTDRYSSPVISNFLRGLLREERERRQAGVEAFDYTLYEFSTWRPTYLVQATTLTLSFVEAATIVGEPTILQFMLRLHQVLCGSMAVALLHRQATLEQLASEANGR